jgi:hypothetical protein
MPPHRTLDSLYRTLTDCTCGSRCPGRDSLAGGTPSSVAAAGAPGVVTPEEDIVDRREFVGIQKSSLAYRRICLAVE